MLFMIVNVLFLYLLLGRWSGISKISGERRLVQAGGAQQTVLEAGTRLKIELQFRIPGLWPIPYVLVRERLVRQGGKDMPFEVSFVPDFRRHGSITYLTPPLSRGHYRFSPTVCSTRDVFGLFEHDGTFESAHRFSVLPQKIRIRHWNELHRGMKGPYSHATALRSMKETTQLNGVRDYHYGDRLSRIHWNATAKSGEWKSKEFEREAMPRSVIVLDRCEAAYPQPEFFELAVSTAASLADFGLRRETATGLVSSGATKEGFLPRASEEQRSLIAKHLTGVACDGQSALYSSMRQAAELLPSGSIAVIVSPQGGEEMLRTMQWLDRKGLAPCLIHLQAPADKTPEALHWQRLVRSHGWPLYTIGHLQELPAALEGGAHHASSV
ncbi:DUF58 domain-containing protein [Paenibacillus sabuli]|nr:DUF58 domain-containing protein [Paenibacillus sabuli]